MLSPSHLVLWSACFVLKSSCENSYLANGALRLGKVKLCPHHQKKGEPGRFPFDPQAGWLRVCAALRGGGEYRE